MPFIASRAYLVVINPSLLPEDTALVAPSVLMQVDRACQVLTASLFLPDGCVCGRTFPHIALMVVPASLPLFSSTFSTIEMSIVAVQSHVQSNQPG